MELAFSHLQAMTRRYQGHGVARDDLQQEVALGLLRARRYDASRGTPFLAWARVWVRQALQQAIVAVAEWLVGAPVGLYVVDLEGVALRRLAGGFPMPEDVQIPQMAGTEIPAGHLEALQRAFAARGLGSIVPLWLRHRAIAVLLVEGAPAPQLEEFAIRAAVALELSLRYIDRLAAARHRQRATAGAELQQGLLPPRLAGFRGAEITASVLPAYDVGGDWFEHTADHDGPGLLSPTQPARGPAHPQSQP